MNRCKNLKILAILISLLTFSSYCIYASTSDTTKPIHNEIKKENSQKASIPCIITNNKNISIKTVGSDILDKYNPFLYNSDPNVEDLFQSAFDGAGYWLSGKFTLSSSSVLNDNLKNYSPDNVTDASIHTAWVEGVPGNGIGEYVELKFKYHDYRSQGDVITDLFISNGYTKNKKVWTENNRVKTLKLSIEGIDYYNIELKDSPYLQLVSFPQSVPLLENKKIRLTIVDVYKGTKYKDTCLSQVHILGPFGN